MEKERVKISVEVPAYLKAWIDKHDLSQNALVTMGLRMLHRQEINGSSEHLLRQLTNELSKHRLPF